jgi:hypothetical protein
VNFQAQTLSQSRCRGHGLALFVPFRPGGVAISPGVDLDRVGADFFAGFYLTPFRINEEAYADASVPKPLYGFLNFPPMRRDIETPFSRQLFPFLRDKARVVGRQGFGERDHGRRHGHL